MPFETKRSTVRSLPDVHLPSNGDLIADIAAGPSRAKSSQTPLTFATFDTYLDTKRPPFTRHRRPQRGSNQDASVVKSHESHYANLRHVAKIYISSTVPLKKQIHAATTADASSFFRSVNCDRLNK
jgi:hypothetical protein